MKKFISAAFAIMICVNGSSQSTETFHDFTEVTILGDTISLSDYAGKKVLVVNTASYCGYTPQYAGLQALDSIYAPYNFEVIGFPCNDFGSQEPGDDSTIFNFCTGIYGVTFQMMHKVDIVSTDTAEVYKWLQLQSRNGVANAPVTWNFHKFCIDEAGHWVMHFPQTTLPFDTAIVNWILSPPVTSVNNIDVENSFIIKGNPVGNQLVISHNISAQLNVEVLNVVGERVVSKSFPAGSVNHLTVNVSSLPKGIYFATIESNTGRTTKKFAKQ